MSHRGRRPDDRDLEAKTVTSDHSSHLHSTSGTRHGETVPAGHTFRGRLHALWHTLVGAVGLIMGLVPHVLHHIGLLAGTALVAGSGGTALFGALGLLASIPMLARLYRRYGSWIAPVLDATGFRRHVFPIGVRHRSGHQRCRRRRRSRPLTNRGPYGQPQRRWTLTFNRDWAGEA